VTRVERVAPAQTFFTYPNKHCLSVCQSVRAARGECPRIKRQPPGKQTEMATSFLFRATLKKNAKRKKSLLREK